MSTINDFIRSNNAKTLINNVIEQDKELLNQAIEEVLLQGRELIKEVINDLAIMSTDNQKLLSGWVVEKNQTNVGSFLRPLGSGYTSGVLPRTNDKGYVFLTTKRGSGTVTLNGVVSAAEGLSVVIVTANPMFADQDNRSELLNAQNKLNTEFAFNIVVMGNSGPNIMTNRSSGWGF